MQFAIILTRPCPAVSPGACIALPHGNLDCMFPDRGQDIFVFGGDLSATGLKTLEAGQRVTFDIKTNKKGKGPSAGNIRVETSPDNSVQTDDGTTAKSDSPSTDQSQKQTRPANNNQQNQVQIGKHKGIVKFFDVARGFGFIVPDEGDEDIFLHGGDLPATGLTELAHKQRVTFDIRTNRSGREPRAYNVRIAASPADLAQPHDALFKALLNDPQRAGAFLHEHLPNNIAAQLSNEPPVIMNASFIDYTLAQTQSDLLLEVQTKTGSPALVYVLVEHKSYPDPMLPLQLATYMTRVWTHHANTRAKEEKQNDQDKQDKQDDQAGQEKREHDPRKPLPPIIPMALYHGAKRWTASSGLADMIDADDPDLVILPGQSYIFRDLGQIDDAALSQHLALRAGLLALKHTTIDGLIETLAELQRKEGTTGNKPQEDGQQENGPQELIRQILSYILHTYDGLDLDGLTDQMAQHDKSLEAFVGTIAETLIQKGETRGEARGMAVGLAEGEARGEARGEAKSLLLLLESRFGSVPKKIKAQIDNAKIEQLDTWFRKALNASSIEDVFQAQH